MMWDLKMIYIPFLFIFQLKVAFLSSASMKLKGNKTKRQKNENILYPHDLQEDVATTTVSITFSL